MNVLSHILHGLEGIRLEELVLLHISFLSPTIVRLDPLAYGSLSQVVCDSVHAIAIWNQWRVMW